MAYYLEQSFVSEQKLEFINGEIYPSAGASPEHDTIVVNLLRLLLTGNAEQKCEVKTADLRVHIPGTTTYLYPDLALVAGKGFYNEERPKSFLNPSVIVEVTSISNEYFFMHRKLRLYKTIKSLTDIL